MLYPLAHSIIKALQYQLEGAKNRVLDLQKIP